MAEVWRFFAHEDDFADLDEVGACERLGRVLSFPTISSMDAQTVDWQAFDDLRAYMQQGWPGLRMSTRCLIFLTLQKL